MSDSKNATFVPILTVLPEYGSAFLWQIDSWWMSNQPEEERGVGPNLCDSMGWCESMPLSEGLFQKFIDWVVEYEQARLYLDGSNADWDWIAFHARGLQLSHWLKEEVGNTYRVVYVKTGDDPNIRINSRTEILADGSLLPLPPLRIAGRPTALRGFCEHIISGGQTGADRAALDFAIEHGGRRGYTHGGWAPHQRKAEDSRVPLKYQLIELADGGYRQRARRNVEDSDGTLIANLGKLDGGTLATQTFAQQMGKPCLVVQLDVGVTAEAVASVLAWLREHVIKTLNVAGPRESKRPGIYRLTGELLKTVHAALYSE